MTQTPAPKAVHLVGSIGLDTVEEVFGTVGKLLGPYLRRIPDGELAQATVDEHQFFVLSWWSPHRRATRSECRQC